MDVFLLCLNFFWTLRQKEQVIRTQAVNTDNVSCDINTEANSGEYAKEKHLFLLAMFLAKELEANQGEARWPVSLPHPSCLCTGVPTGQSRHFGENLVVQVREDGLVRTARLLSLSYFLHLFIHPHATERELLRSELPS